MKIAAQFLYDLRTLTGFVSGQELQELFYVLGLSNSPKGSVEVDLDQARQMCPALSAELDAPGACLVKHISQYTGRCGFNSVYLPSLRKELCINRYTINPMWTGMLSDMVWELEHENFKS